MTSHKKKLIKKNSTTKNKLFIKTPETARLSKLEQRISLNVDSFLVLCEEGDPTQIALSLHKAKNDFMELGPEMHRIAEQLGGEMSNVVMDFLESIDIVLHGQGMLDEDLITHCADMATQLKAKLKPGRSFEGWDL